MMSTSDTVYRSRMDTSLLLSLEEENEFGREIEKGNEKARGELIVRFAPLVYNLIRRYRSNKSVDLDDLWQAGMEGLLIAVDKWRYKEGRFATYARWWVRSEINVFLLSDRQVVMPSYMIHKRYLAIKKKAQEIARELGRVPRPEEIADRLHLSLRGVIIALGYTTPSVVSIDSPKSDDEEITLHDTLPSQVYLNPEEYVEAVSELKDTEKRIREVITHVRTHRRWSDKYKEVFLLTYGLKSESDNGERHTLDAVAHKVGISRERVRQLLSVMHEELYGRKYLKNTDLFADELMRRDALREIVAAAQGES